MKNRGPSMAGTRQKDREPPLRRQGGGKRAPSMEGQGMWKRILSMKENGQGYKESPFEGQAWECGHPPQKGDKGPSMEGTEMGEEGHPRRGKGKETGNPSLREQTTRDRGPSIEEEEQEGNAMLPPWKVPSLLCL